MADVRLAQEKEPLVCRRISALPYCGPRPIREHSRVLIVGGGVAVLSQDEDKTKREEEDVSS
jgi:hypothetical protein